MTRTRIRGPLLAAVCLALACAGLITGHTSTWIVSLIGATFAVITTWNDYTCSNR